VRFIKEVGDVFLSESGCPGFKDFQDLRNHEDTKKRRKKGRRGIFRQMHHFFKFHAKTQRK
jgi:hypothetical protein